MRMKIVLACVVALGLLGAGAATAAKGHGTAANMRRGHALVKQSAQYLGISVKDLRAELKTGKSLDQVADATAGKSSGGLLSTLVGVAKQKLDARVAAGKLKPERETKLLERVTKRLQSRLARVHAAKA